jgi:glycosyltransferase involved in cell wall biosynthesis
MAKQYTTMLKFPESQQLFDILLSEEMKLLDLFDHVIAISGDEAEVMSRHLPSGKVSYLPPVITDHKCTVQDKRYEYDFLYVGSYHAPGLRSIQEFYQDTFLPYLKPGGYTLALAGEVGELSGIEDPQVRILGYVPDLSSLYSKAKIVICPIRYGAGCNIKVLEALIHGKALVGTPQAFRGLNVDAGQFCVASEPRTFSFHVKHLLNDGKFRERQEQVSLRQVNLKHSPKLYNELFKRLLNRAFSDLHERTLSNLNVRSSH